MRCKLSDVPTSFSPRPHEDMRGEADRTCQECGRDADDLVEVRGRFGGIRRVCGECAKWKEGNH